ncbi:MAG: hydrogenase maturation protease [Mycobacterium sp.]|nr:hydrogenase maturation protease [Mycobacterium sp.]
MTPNAIVIGLGNDFRRDDGVGLTVADQVAERNLPDVRVVTGIGEPTALLDAWDCIARAIVVDAVAGADSTPGRIRRWTALDLQTTVVTSSHALGLAQTCGLGRTMARMPHELVVFTVDVADTNHGVGLSPAVAAAVPELVDAVLTELNR